MRWLLIIGGFVGLTACARYVPTDAAQIVIDNARVRVFRTAAGALRGIEHRPAVVVSIDSGPDEGTAVWVEDAAAAPSDLQRRGTIVVVQPLDRRAAAPPSATRPGEAPFTGMSFKQIFDNDRVSVIRARMEVGAREGFHTHGSDTVVIHLSGGEIEDTANGRTAVNRWKRGDVEFEEVGSSHSARNLGAAVDVVLVALKPNQA